jgi:hypothetical protein
MVNAQARLTCTPAAILALLAVLADPAFGAEVGQAGTQPDRVKSGEEVLLETYVRLWNSTKGGVRLDVVTERVAALKSTDGHTRQTAYEWLKQESGVEFVDMFVVTMAPADERDTTAHCFLVTADWEQYAVSLRIAVEKKVTEILNKPTAENAFARQQAAAFIGQKAPHPAFLPLLRAVVENRDDDKSTRVAALRSISLIPHEGMIEYLIEQLGSDLAFHVSKMLFGIAPVSMALKPEEGYAEQQKIYLDWWSKNKATFKYDRFRALRR